MDEGKKYKYKNRMSLSSMDQIFRDADADRVSLSAKKSLRDLLEKIAFKVAEKSIKVSENSGRKTVKGKDIELIGGRFLE